MEIKNQNQLKKKRPRQKKSGEIQKPIWIKLSKNYFDSFTKDLCNGLNNDNFKTTVDKKAYDLKNAKKYLVKLTTKKIIKKKTLKLYSDLIIPDIAAL